MADNFLVLSGHLAGVPNYRNSPSRIEHCQFYLRHYSQQIEAGLMRKAQCTVAVVASGTQFNRTSLPLSIGSSVRVSGFLQNHRSHSGQSRLVLHAQKIELLS